MSSRVFGSLPANVRCEVKVGDQVERLPIEFVPPVSSVIVAFYQAEKLNMLMLRELSGTINCHRQHEAVLHGA